MDAKTWFENLSIEQQNELFDRYCGGIIPKIKELTKEDYVEQDSKGNGRGLKVYVLVEKINEIIKELNK